MALVTDALTQGLSGYGRADQPKTMSLSVLLQVIDPNAFAGLDAFTHQTSWTAEACRTNPPRPGGPAVRLPGQKALANQRQADVAGVPLQASVVAQMLASAGQTGVVWPSQAQ
jgi:L-lactate dehydrogenase